MNLSNEFKSKYFVIITQRKSIFLLISFIATLITVIPNENVFAADDLNTINPRFKGDEDQSSNTSSENPYSNALGKSIGKTACSLGMGAVGSNLCS